MTKPLPLLPSTKDHNSYVEYTINLKLKHLFYGVMKGYVKLVGKSLQCGQVTAVWCQRIGCVYRSLKFDHKFETIKDQFSLITVATITNGTLKQQ